MEDKNNPQLSEEIKQEFKLTDEEIKAHFLHQCEAGFDPLLCVNKLVNWVDLRRPVPLGGQFSIGTKQICVHHDRVIDEARYIDLIHRANITKAELDNIIYIPYEKVLEHDPTIINAKAAIFWLYPSGCRTLTDLFKKYEKKIKDELFLII